MISPNTKEFSANTKDDTFSTLKKSAYEVSDDMHNAAHKAGRSVRNALHSASDEITHASDKVTGEIRGNPVRSSIIALGAGVLIGALLRR